MFHFRRHTRKSNFSGENGLLRDVSRVSIFGCFDVNIRLMRKRIRRMSSALIFMGTALIYLQSGSKRLREMLFVNSSVFVFSEEGKKYHFESSNPCK